jgi:hypothetical protein
MSLEEAPRAFDMFKNKEDNCIKVVLKPDWDRAAKDEMVH